MNSSKKVAIGITVALLLALAIRVALIYQERHDTGPAPETAAKVDPDELVFLKKQRPSSLGPAAKTASAALLAHQQPLLLRSPGLLSLRVLEGVQVGQQQRVAALQRQQLPAASSDQVA